MQKKTKSKNLRKRNLSPVMILAAFAIVGVVMIGFGIYNNATSDYTTMAIKSESELNEDVKNKMAEVDNLRSERDEEYNNSALSDKYYELSRKITTAEGELLDLEAELYNVKNGVYDGLKNRSLSGSVPLIVSGVALIIIGAGFYMNLSNRKKRNKILSISEA